MLLALILCMSLSSCFTGIEGTKKITLSRDDVKKAAPTPEEKFLADIIAAPASDWLPGRQFAVVSPRVVSILSPLGNAPQADMLAGDTILFVNSSLSQGTDGVSRPSLLFRHGDDTYIYTDRRSEASSLSTLTSDKIPMLVDLEMVRQAEERLRGRRFFLRSLDWQSADGSHLRGEKFIPVTITDVSVGDLAFPVRVAFRADDGRSGFFPMSLGGSGSRDFSKLFFLSDPHKKYPDISDEMWQHIRRGETVAGMTKLECRLAIGDPSEVNPGRDYNYTYDLWQYPDGTTLFSRDGILSGSKIPSGPFEPD